MIFQKVNYESFPAKDLICSYGINTSLYQIYSFYKQFSQQSPYTVELDDETDIESIIEENDLHLFNRLGIYFVGGNAKSNDLIDMDSREYLLILSESDVSDETSLTTAYENFKKELPINAKFLYCIIEKEFEEDSYMEAMSILDTVKSLDPYVTIANSIFVGINNTTVFINSRYDLFSSKKGPDGNNLFELVDLYDRIGFILKDNSSVSIINNLNKLVQDLAVTGKVNTLYCLKIPTTYDSYSKAKIKWTYLRIASYLMHTEKKRFIIEDDDLSIYLEGIRNLVSRKYNHLCDYLKFLMNPLEVSLMFDSRVKKANACVLDYSRLFKDNKRDYSKYDIEIVTSSIKYDLINNRLMDNTVEEMRIPVRNIEILDVYEYFNLYSDNFQESLVNLDKLNEVIMQAEEIIRSSKMLLTEEEALNCTNVLLYRFSGQVYFAYVGSITGSYPYIMVPLSKGYTPFLKDIDVSSMNTLYSTSLLFDNRLLIRSLSNMFKSITFERLSYDVNKSSKGFVISIVNSKDAIIDDKSGCNVDQIGIWSGHTSQLRAGGEKMLTDLIPINVIRKNKLFSFYGGPHPSVAVDMYITPDFWRI